MALKLGNLRFALHWSSSFVGLLLSSCYLKHYTLKIFLGTNWTKIWFKERFASCKQIFGIHKMSPFLLRTNLPQIFTIYDIQALRILLEDFQENILGGVNLVYNRYSEQSVCNLIKRRTLLPWNFRRWMAVDGCFWTFQDSCL